MTGPVVCTRRRLGASLWTGPMEGDQGASPVPSPTGGDVYAARIAQLVDPRRLPHLADVSSALEDDGDFYGEELEFGPGVLLDGIAALVSRDGGAR